MVNHELVAVPIPSTQPQVEALEKWLEDCSSSGAALICFMPTQIANTQLAVMAVEERGRIPQPPKW